MIKTMQIQTSIGFVAMPLVHKNGVLQVIEAPTQDPEFFFYNTVHNNGFKVPETDTNEIADAILICDWCVENFPEFSAEIFAMSKARQDEFKDRLHEFRFIQIRDWEDD